MTYMFNQIHYYLQTYLKNFRNTCIKIYELDLAHFLSAPGFTWQTYLKRQR